MQEGPKTSKDFSILGRCCGMQRKETCERARVCLTIFYPFVNLSLRSMISRKVFVQNKQKKTLSLTPTGPIEVSQRSRCPQATLPLAGLQHNPLPFCRGQEAQGYNVCNPGALMRPSSPPQSLTESSGLFPHLPV